MLYLGMTFLDLIEMMMSFNRFIQLNSHLRWQKTKIKVGIFFWLILLIFHNKKNVQRNKTRSFTFTFNRIICLDYHFFAKNKSVMTPWGTDVLIDMQNQK